VKPPRSNHRRLTLYHATGCKEKVDPDEKALSSELVLLIQKTVNTQVESAMPRRA
jgi:hypothetical protein